MPDDDQRPWWETGAAPEALLSTRWRRHRVLIAVVSLSALGAFVGYFIWIGLQALSM